ncbi:BolA/IbaG family iron-sulfur metabolism protein [Ectothiorhodospiraceae bacterium WFHF3C12]|nr:BolA/IbaG family iron-sulfur metabolism protein [Ectothiorhodospiraceae bacterium WFHF3C12]
MEPQEIARLLEQGLNDARVHVDGDGHHFQALIVTPAFEGLSLIQRHRMVNEVLEAHLDSGVLHAISMRTLTPEQYDAERT